MHQPLKGVRILDLSMWWSGPMCTSYLGALGAEIIKLESIQSPDGFRFMLTSPKEDWWEFGPQFNAANHNKRGATLNLNDEEGKAYFKKIMEKCDIVIENFTPRVMENFQLTYDVLSQYKKDVIMLSMPAYGKTGPYRDQPGFAYTFEMLSGIAQLNGYQDGKPMTVLGVADVLAGFHAAAALLIALEHRDFTGEGQEIELAQNEGCVNYMGAPIADFVLNGENWSRVGNRQPGIAPQGVYRTQGKDSWVAISITSDEEWQSLCLEMNAQSLLNDERLKTAAGRFAAHDELDAIISKWTQQETHHAIASRLQKVGVPAGPVLEVHEMEHDPFLKNMYQEVTREYVGTHLYPSWPIKWNNERVLHKAPAPLLGQDNEYVFKELLQLSDEEYNSLLEKNIIGNKMLS
ncbi:MULTISPECIES: CaiB/BaiF CoA transferase family protein [unclassified Lysinibacillus]|uniref:CaiB/BaiF CoA transferase family protein n=1 Tax=unclassified Lysinibacillus TaxID=2636778 RepID=UPI0038035CCD